jgi:hypothetical protein
LSLQKGPTISSASAAGSFGSRRLRRRPGLIRGDDHGDDVQAVVQPGDELVAPDLISDGDTEGEGLDADNGAEARRRKEEAQPP